MVGMRVFAGLASFAPLVVCRDTHWDLFYPLSVLLTQWSCRTAATSRMQKSIACPTAASYGSLIVVVLKSHHILERLLQESVLCSLATSR